MSDLRVYDIEQLIEDTVNLVSFPQVVISLLQTLSDEFADRRDIASLIKQDPALTAALIRLCNSPVYYSGTQPVLSIDEAIKRIGTEQTTSLCLALCACDATGNLRNEVIELKHYWHHCLLTACICSVLAEDKPSISSGAAFTGGLLHDIGQLPLFYQYPAESHRVLEYCQFNTDRLIAQAEKQIFGFTHEDVGQLLARKWNFPEQLALCISKHHQTNLDTEHTDLVMVVQVANILSESLETQEDITFYLDDITPFVRAHVIPDIEMLPEVLEKASRYFDDVHSSILM